MPLGKRAARPGALTPSISPEYVWLLSYYAASELAGGLLMGRLARWTADPDLRAKLTWHCAEETRHAWLWTETILDVGAVPCAVEDTYQSRYFAQAGAPADELQLLTVTTVFETRVAKHFACHLRQQGVHPRVQATLRTMVDDEGRHLGWVRERLARWVTRDDGAEARACLQRFARIDRSVYAAELTAFEQRGDELRALALAFRQAMDTDSR